MSYGNFRLETKRLALVAINESFINDIFSNFTNEVTYYMYPKAPDHIDETKEFVASQMKKNREGRDFGFAIIDKITNEFLGCGGIHNISSPMPELGIWLKKDAHGSGYGMEAMRGAAIWAAKNLNYIRGILYPVDFKNYPSRRIAISMGGHLVAKQNIINRSGRELDIAVYVIDTDYLKELNE